MKKGRIIVDGDSYKAAFLLEANSLRLPPGDSSEPHEWSSNKALYAPLEVGSSYIHNVVKWLLLRRGAAGVTEFSQNPCYDHPLEPIRLFHLKGAKEEIPDYGRFGKKLPVLKWDEKENRLWRPHSGGATPRQIETESDDVLIERIGSPDVLGLKSENSVSRFSSIHRCRAHIQIGRADLRKDIPLVQPSLIRIVIVSLSDICAEARIRKSLSYESIIVDILRTLREYGSPPEPTELFDRIAGTIRWPSLSRKRLEGGKIAGTAPAQIYIIVRINHAALLLYRWTPPRAGDDEKEGDAERKKRESAHLFYHESLPAPVEDAALGRMDGFTGFLAAKIACAVHEVEETVLKSDPAPVPPSWLIDAISEGIFLQVAHRRRGLLRLFFQDQNYGSPQENKANWKAIVGEGWESRSQYFSDLQEWLQKDTDGETKRDNVKYPTLDISNAVSHRTQWFLAGSQVALGQSVREQKEAFIKAAMKWLTSNEKKPKDVLPLVSIGELQLMDRREVEDYLALRDAFRNYGKERSPRPLNIAVFGSPGSGKSFGVKQVAGHIAKDDETFTKQTLTFNLSQFTCLADFTNALHLVRNECLKGPIPVVFLDEFDSAFEGRPFGWLKYFLAPMQDGQFTERGTVHELGRCVLVFAGGVNRTFEEMNGRLRNAGFVEAKGPDFISRLRAHLNIRGINKPEDEVDQDRYILRRGIMLHGMLTKRLELPGNGDLPRPGLLHEVVARAFCGVESFKHGARSMEAILDMCDLQRGQRLGPSDLPSRVQLDMHVDAAEFMNFVYKDKET